MYDFLIVGAGLAGATFAEQATRAGKKCLVIEKRHTIGGNCYTYEIEGIDVHAYGPHLFHTDSYDIWNYVQQFATFNDYHHTILARTRGPVVPIPINLHTLHSLFGVTTPREARAYFAGVVEATDGNSIESWCLNNIGRELYELLVRDYTIKQWNMQPSLLPESIIKRLPLRTVYNNNAYNDRFQGIPIAGYTALIEGMLFRADVTVNVDFLEDIPYYRNMAKRVVYTGPIDALFNYDKGRLPYRSIYHETSIELTPDYQGIGQVNYTSLAQPWTRIIEHKHFCTINRPFTVISKEFSVSESEGEPYYPINTEENTFLAESYKQRAEDEGYILCGRLAHYRYYDMHQVIGQTLKTVRKILNETT